MKKRAHAISQDLHLPLRAVGWRNRLPGQLK